MATKTKNDQCDRYDRDNCSIRSKRPHLKHQLTTATYALWLRAMKFRDVYLASSQNGFPLM